MAVNFNDFWIAGAVRTRAKASDPFAGLRGRAYIDARKLDQKRVERTDAKATATAKSESRENLINALNQDAAKAAPEIRFFLSSGVVDFLPNDNRRFFIVPKLTAGEA